MINTPTGSDASTTQELTNGDFDDLRFSRPSKTKIKNSLERFRKFTAEMVDLPQGRFNQLEFPEDIKEALITARNLASHGARRRQMSFVARLVEDLDIDAIRETIRNLDHGRAPSSTPAASSATPVTAEAELLANRLLDGDDQTVYALSASFDPSERQSLRHFLRKTKKSLQSGGNRAELTKALATYLGTLRTADGPGEGGF